MFRNYFKTAIRSLARNKFFAAINIAGLSIGIASCLLILLYAKNELSYDRFHTNGKQLYQLTCDRIEKEGKDEKFAIAAMVQGPAFKREIPEIREFVRVNNKQTVIKKGNEVFNEDITWVDKSFFSVFSFDLRVGDPEKVLADPHSMVLTEAMAEKYFGTRNAVGKTLELEINGRFEPFIVSGVAGTPPENSSIKFKLLLPFGFLDKESPDNGWMWVSYPTYFLLDSHADLAAVKTKMNRVYSVQAKPEIDMNHQAGYDNTFIWGLSPLTTMHLNTEYEGVAEASDPIFSYILTAIAFFILLIACINFVNLTVAQSLRRSKEIGIRKVAGSLRSQLVGQFLGESLLVCLVSFLVAVLLAGLTLPLFSQMAGKRLNLGSLFDLQLLTGLVLLFLCTGILAGFYPALILSGFNPVEALEGRSKYGKNNYLARGLVVLQFALATFFIIATLFVGAQFNYMTKADLGYHDKDLVEFIADKAIMNKPLMDLIKTEYSMTSGVQQASYCNVGKFGGKTVAGGKEFEAVYARVDADYLGTLQVPVLKGRNFSRAFPADSLNSVLVNEAFAKEAGWDDPVGKTVDFMNFPGWGNKKIMVIGLAKDYHFASLKEKIRPLVLTMDPRLPLGRFLVRIDHQNIPATIRSMEKTYRSLIPDHPFQYYFKEETNRRNYENENKWKKIITVATLLTVFISCIGLFGLAMLSTARRYKEIGIRKVLGASTGKLAVLLSMDFIKLVLIAFLIALPAGWYAADRWLQNFAYRIEISWWTFGLAGMLALGIAIFTVSFHTVRASLANPVHSLRAE